MYGRDQREELWQRVLLEELASCKGTVSLVVLECVSSWSKNNSPLSERSGCFG